MAFQTFVAVPVTTGSPEDGPQDATDRVAPVGSGATAAGGHDTDQAQVEQRDGPPDRQLDQSVADRSGTSVAAAASTDHVQLQQ